MIVILCYTYPCKVLVKNMVWIFTRTVLIYPYTVIIRGSGEPSVLHLH